MADRGFKLPSGQALSVTMRVTGGLNNEYAVDVKVQPLIPLLDLAEVLELVAAEIKAGRLDHLILKGGHE